jgi:hypothetical protein
MLNVNNHPSWCDNQVLHFTIFDKDGTEFSAPNYTKLGELLREKKDELRCSSRAWGKSYGIESSTKKIIQCYKQKKEGDFCSECSKNMVLGDNKSCHSSESSGKTTPKKWQLWGKFDQPSTWSTICLNGCKRTTTTNSTGKCLKCHISPTDNDNDREMEEVVPFAQLIPNESFLRLGQHLIQKNSPNLVLSLLEKLDLVEYHSILIDEGYDKIEDLRNAPIDELVEIGLKKPHARRIQTELDE